MRAFRLATAALLIAAPAMAQQAQDHSAHHPAAAAPPTSASQPSSAGAQPPAMMCQDMMRQMAGTGQGMMGGGMTPQGMTGSGMMGSGMMGGGPAGQHRGGAGAMMGQPERHVEGRLGFLKAELKVTEAQSAQWTAFAEAVRANAKTAADMHSGMMAGQSPGAPLPERLAQQGKALSGQLTGLKKVEEALGKLYAVLDPDQKKQADTIVIGPMGIPIGMM